MPSSEAYGRGLDVSEAPVRLNEFLLYFLWLGSLGFGGPIALAGYMQRDLVEKRRWLSKEDYLEGLALAQLAPGPLAAQLAIYLGWVRFGVKGATLVAFVFVLPSFVMVVALAWLYLHFGGLPWMRGMFYGIGAAVIAIISRSAYKLTKTALGKDFLLWSLFIVSALVTAWTESEIVWLFLAAGFLSWAIRALSPRTLNSALAALPVWMFSGLHGPASDTTLSRLFRYFAEAGAFVFGSGLAIVPFLHNGVVNQYAWLTERQFLDAVAVAMITPGPVVITVAFIGYLVGGSLGATIAAIATFLPCYLFVVIPAPYFRRYAKNIHINAFVSGVTAAATGAIAGAAFVLGRRAIIDLTTLLIALLTLGVLLKVKKVPEPLLIGLAGVLGWMIAR